MHRSSWRTPIVILACGTVVLLLSFGIRTSFGLFLKPITGELGWGRERQRFRPSMICPCQMTIGSICPCRFIDATISSNSAPSSIGKTSASGWFFMVKIAPLELSLLHSKGKRKSLFF